MHRSYNRKAHAKELLRGLWIVFLNIVRSGVLLLLLCISAGPPIHAQSEDRAATIGSSAAPVKIDLYFSYACPHCLGLLSNAQADIDEAVESDALQIRYLEIPRFYALSTKNYEDTNAQAEQRSMHLSLIMQCLVQQGGPDGFNRAHKALPGLLEDVIGSGRTLPQPDAPSNQVDWHYWVWADEPNDLTTSLLQPLINVAGTNVQQCDRDSVSKAISTRMAQLPGPRRKAVPQIVINGELVPPGPNQFAQLETILQNTAAIADIVQSDFDFDTLHAIQGGLLNGATVSDVDADLTQRVSLNRQGKTYRLSFGPDETRITERGTGIASFPPAPLLDFLFFGANASMIADVDVAALPGADQILAFTDLTGNKLLVSRRANTITSFSYQPTEPNGFGLTMDRK